jgi:type VI protein secretion system component VasK
MEQELERLPVSADQSADYDRHFNLLKAYLMLTVKPGETTPRFLEDALAERYAQNRHIPAEATEVARRQFRFLAAEQRAGVCAAPANDASVSRARRYLWSFQPLDRIYGNIVAAVSAGRPPFRFADPSGAVSAPHEIASIYTAHGFPQAASAIQNAQDYFNREPWVLGPPPQQSLIVNDLRDQLTKRYTDDYVAQWSNLLQSASVAGYPGLKQALPKLQSIAGTQSPLLLLFCEISTNTAIASAQVTAAFQPFHTLEPPATCANKLNDAPTEEYMMALARIQFQLEELVKKPDAPEVSLDSVNAKVAAQNTARRANLPAKAAELLLAPIVYAERLETRLAPDVLNASGADFCRSTAIFRKFPFDAKSGQQATLEEVRQVFQAESGSLWKFYESTLQAVIVPGSGGFTSKPGAKVKVTPEFLSFFNRAAAFSSAVFRSGADPSLSYTIQAKPSPGVASFTLDISGKTLTGSESGGEAQEFIWTGGVDTVRLTPKLTSGTIPEPLAISGVWAVIDLLTRQGMLSANNTISEIEVSGGRTGRGNAKTVTTVRLSAETKKGGSLLSLTPRGCVSQIAR